MLTLEEAKKHLNIDTLFVADDTYITDLIEVAQNVIEHDTQRSIDNIIAVEGSVPALLKHAAKILVATYYENREATIVGVSIHEVPLSYKSLIGLYRKYTVG